MTLVDLTLLGKRYNELDPTIELGENSLVSVLKTGEPENNSITFLSLQKNIAIRHLKDLDNETLTNNAFLRFSTQQNKFVLGLLQANDIPDLDANKIVSGVFNVDRLPNLPISKIIDLQTVLNGKENIFSKGDVVSSTLSLTNNTGRLVGSANLGIELDLSVLNTQLKFLSRIVDVEGDEQINFQDYNYLQLAGVGIDISYETENNRIIFQSTGSGLLQDNRFIWNFGDSRTFTIPVISNRIHAVFVNGWKIDSGDYAHSIGSNQITLNEEVFPNVNPGRAWIIHIYYFIGEEDPEFQQIFEPEFEPEFE